MSHENWIWGKHSVELCLQERPELILELFAQRDRRGVESENKIQGLVDELSLKVNTVFKFPKHIEEKRHQGWAARIKSFPVQWWRDFKEDYEGGKLEKKALRVLVLDRVQDPQNFGAILRSAAAFAFHYVVVPTREQCPLTGAVSVASAGQLFNVQIVQADSLKQVIEFFHKEAYLSCALKVGAESFASFVASSEQVKEKLILVLGSEGKGLKPSLEELIQKLLGIEMENGVESLNVSTSAAIAMHALR